MARNARPPLPPRRPIRPAGPDPAVAAEAAARAGAGCRPVVPEPPPRCRFRRLEAPTVVSAAPGVGVAAGVLPPAPLTLPVIVAPVSLPRLAPGVGGGGGGAGTRESCDARTATRRPGSAARGPRAAAGERGQQRHNSCFVVPDRLHGIFAECRNIAGSGLGCAWSCGHPGTHRCRWFGWLSPGQGGPRSAHRPHCAVRQLTNWPPLRGGQRIVDSSNRGFVCLPAAASPAP